MKISLPLLGALSAAFMVPAWAAPTSIYAVQGAGAQSPVAGQTVTVAGVVTADFSGADKFSGFYIEDPTGDGDPQTSDAIFVYVNAPSKVANVKFAPGDRVQVSGRVSEYKGQTQVSSPTEIKVTAHGEPLAPLDVTLASNTNWESLEGMLVHFPQTLVVAAQNELTRYGTLKLAPARIFNPTNVRPIEAVDADPQVVPSITLDDGSDDSYPKTVRYMDAQGTRRTGSTVANLTGIVGEYDGVYRIEPTIDPVLSDANPRPLAPPAVGGTLRVAAANVLNYWTTFKDKDHPKARGADNAPQFERQSGKTMAEMKGLDADIVGLMELENNPATIAEFVRRLNEAEGADQYAAVTDPGEGLGDDAIRVGLIYRPAVVEPIGPPMVATDAIFDRRPLAQTFRDKATGGVFTVVVNHFKSKGSAPKTGDTDKGEGAWNQKRTKQAQRLATFIDELKVSSGDPDVLALGDLNAYVEEAPLRTLRDAGLVHLNLRLAPEDRYSFSFDGFFGSLDHALATPSLDAQVAGFAEWHVNSDEPFFNVYNRIKVADYKADPYRASDHDPLVIGLNLTAN